MSDRAMIAGHCAKCGAPYTASEGWYGVGPAPILPSCGCWNVTKYQTTSSIQLGVSRCQDCAALRAERDAALAENAELRERLREAMALLRNSRCRDKGARGDKATKWGRDFVALEAKVKS